MSRLFPSPVDNRFRGLTPALWVFALITFLRIALGLAHVFRADGGAQSVSTIPLDTYPPGAAQNVVALFARMGLEQLLVGSILLVVLGRYRAMIPLMYALLVAEAAALEGIARLKPLALAGTSGARPIHLALAALTVLGFVLSLLGSGQETGNRRGGAD